jgi:hypothetical protein
VTVQPDAPGGAGPPPAGSAAGQPARSESRRRSWRRRLAGVALLLALCGLAASAAGVAGQVLPRRFTLAQQRHIVAWEMARRWRTERAGRIFPAGVRYHLPGAAVNSGRDLSLTARRLGIARQATCTAAADRAAARVLDRLGCQGVLRATYVDSTGSMLTTVGVAVLRDNRAATEAASDLSGARGHRDGWLPGVRPVGYPRTLAADFRERDRQFTTVAPEGPYLIMSAAGFSDGRPKLPVTSDGYTEDEMRSFAVGVANAIGAPLGTPGRVPHCPGSPGC